MATRKGGGDISERMIEQLRESVHAGVPWIIPQNPPHGYSDLLYLVRGHLYFSEFIRSNDDTETIMELWEPLREDILKQHISTEPASRPWAWWALEDREPRRRLSRKPCACPPGAVFTGLPPLNLSWFGHSRGCRCEYESESDYLKRLGLLTRTAKKET